MSMLRRYWAGGLLVVALGAATAASGQNAASYQPAQRLRTALETCRADEVVEGAQCIKKCQPGFRLDVARDKRPTCVSIGGRVTSTIGSSTEKPIWTPPPKDGSPQRSDS